MPIFSLADLFQLAACSAFASLLNPPRSRKLLVEILVCPGLIKFVTSMSIAVIIDPGVGSLLAFAFPLAQMFTPTISLLHDHAIAKVRSLPVVIVLLVAAVILTCRATPLKTMLPFFEILDGRPVCKSCGTVSLSVNYLVHH